MMRSRRRRSTPTVRSGSSTRPVPSSRRSSAVSRPQTAGRSSSGSGTPRTSSPSSAADPGASRMRVAALADVHGNAPALEAVLADVARERVDLIVFCGDLTWGPLPNETLAIVRALEIPARFVRGNADRMVGSDESGRGRWLAAAHGEEGIRLVNGFDPFVVADVDALGPTRFVHGSPRSDEECVTPRTPDERVREFMADVPERVVVPAHVHVSYDRLVDGVRLVGPGSVGRPYEGERGARWALLGPDVDLRRTEYDYEAAAALYRASGIPEAEEDVKALLEPMNREEIIAYAEERVFAG